MELCFDCDKYKSPQDLKTSSPHSAVQNKIKTNGSLPKENRNKLEAAYDEEVDNFLSARPALEESDQNSQISKFCKTPRTRIKTCVTSSKAGEMTREDPSGQPNSENSHDLEPRLEDHSPSQRTVLVDDLRKLLERISELQCEEDYIFQNMNGEDPSPPEDIAVESAAIKQLEDAAQGVQEQLRQLDAQRNQGRKLQANQQASLKRTISLKQKQIQSLHTNMQMEQELETLNYSLDNDKAMLEDLEFQYLEAESEWISKHEELLVQLRFHNKIISSIKTHWKILQQQHETISCSQELEQDLLQTVHTLERKRDYLEDVDQQIIAFFQKNAEKACKNGSKRGLSQSLIAWHDSSEEHERADNFLHKSFNENMLNGSIENVFDIDCKSSPTVEYFDNIQLKSASSSTDHGSILSSTNEQYSNDTTDNNQNLPEEQSCYDKESRTTESESSIKIENTQRYKTPKYQRPLTRYFASASFSFDLKHHIELAGHQIATCPHVQVETNICKGYLHKLGATFKGWSRRFFVLNRVQQSFVYYIDSTQKKVRGGAYFSAIEEVYLDHDSASKWDKTNRTFIVKTKKRTYELQAATNATARIWIDVLMTATLGNENNCS